MNEKMVRWEMESFAQLKEQAHFKILKRWCSEKDWGDTHF